MIRINEAITCDLVDLIFPDGRIQRGVPTNRARGTADHFKLDLVEINPHSNPPTCKIMEAGPWIARIEASKKERVKYDRRWRLAARVIEAARKASGWEAPVGKGEEVQWLREALVAWDAFNTAPPDPPLAAAKAR